MGKIKTEVNELVTKSRGLKIARDDANRWFKNTKNSSGDTSVSRDNRPFKPGKIYVFRYENPIKMEKLKLWDRNPVVLSLGRSEGLDIGINLNYLLYPKRLDLLDRVYEQYQSIIERSSKKGSDALSETEITSFNYDNIKRFLEKSGYLKAVRTYDTGRRSNSAVISYREWRRAVLLNLIDIAKASTGKAQF